MSDDAVRAPGHGKLPVRTKLGFGVADLGGNLYFTAMSFWTMAYLTDTVKLSPALAGVAVMVAKIWDAVNDPLMGFISDRTKTRLGRRRPYILFAAVPLMLFMWMFYTAPRFTDPIVLTVWATAALCLLNTAFTAVNIPYGALTPELTDDYNERTSLNGYRFSFAVVGTIVGAGAVLPLVGLGADRRAGFAIVGLVLGAVMAVSSIITGVSVRERPRDPDEKHESFLATYLVVFRNKPYLVLLFTYALHLAGIAFLSGILVYYFKYLFGNEGLTTMAMLILLVVAMASIPVSVVLSKRIGKKLVYQLSFLIMAAGCMVIYLLGHVLGPTFTIAMMAVTGIGLGFAYVPPFAMLPDAIELEALNTGIRREGAYYGIWTFMASLFQSGAMALLGFILSIAGYVPDIAQGPAALGAIRLMIGPIPAVILVGATVLVQFYPIDEKTYESTLAAHRAEKA